GDRTPPAPRGGAARARDRRTPPPTAWRARRSGAARGRPPSRRAPPAPGGSGRATAPRRRGRRRGAPPAPSGPRRAAADRRPGSGLERARAARSGREWAARRRRARAPGRRRDDGRVPRPPLPDNKRAAAGGLLPPEQPGDEVAERQRPLGVPLPGERGGEGGARVVVTGNERGDRRRITGRELGDEGVARMSGQRQIDHHDLRPLRAE